MSQSYARHTKEVTHPLLPNITSRRLNLFNDGHYAAYNLSSTLDRARVDGDDWVNMTAWSAPGLTKPTFEEAVTALRSEETKLYRKGDWLGPSWTNHWLKVELKIPADYAKSDEPVMFEFDPGCEALIYTLEGHPLHVVGDQEDRRVEHIIPRDAVKAGRYDCYIEISVNGMFGLGLNGFRHQRPDMNVSFQLITADIVLIRSEARALQIDFQILNQLGNPPEGGESSSLSRRALRAANEIMNRFRRTDGDEEDGSLDETIRACREIGWEVLGPLDPESVKSLCTHVQDDDEEATIWGIGHCHIDTAWLWRYSQSQQKIARSWSTQVDLIERFPNHHFAASSAQQYAWLEELYPSLFESVKEQIKAGHFHPVGGAWLEHDCLLPSGESLCRQYLYGQRYFQQKFGVRCREAWLPDTFGYASQLPQILRLSGINYFFTQKLSWNNINVFPYSTFNWVALDGSQVLSHMTPVDTYNATANYKELRKGATKNKNLGVTDECLLLFGNGDGGGGPTPKMLNKLQRLGSVANNNREMPSMKLGKVSDFFDHLCKKTKGGKLLPTWRGELYFELHRGTYTSQAGLKAGNRKMEKLLRDVEYCATLASLHVPSYKYPREQLDKIWQDVLLNQFHDVLPGTSIRMAVDDALEIYEQRGAQAQQLLDEAIAAVLKGTVKVNGHAVSQAPIVLDPARLTRVQVVPVPRSQGRHLPSSQDVSSNDQVVLGLLQTDSTGVGSFISSDQVTSSPRAAQKGENTFSIENGVHKLIISNGRITSLVDLAWQRELLTPGPGAETGGLMIYDDFPLAYDAWDAEIYHLDCAITLFFDHVEVDADGPLRASLKAISIFGKSKVELTISLDVSLPESDLSPIRVDVHADWHEKHKFLKFVLPVDIHAPSATYGTQYGLIERPTHRNTTTEQAKFEVCGHMCGDLSEPGYGVTIATDYKYGYSVEGNTMRLSLLRSATAPDPEQDMGEHDLSFAIIPHANRFIESGAYKAAMAFVNDVHVVTPSGSGGDLSGLRKTAFEVSGDRSDSIIVDAIKRGEDDADTRKTVVIRMFESQGGRASGKLKITGVQPQLLQWVNILEEKMEDEPELQWSKSGDGVEAEISFRGFELRTLQIVL
ncbi:hypothetical protein I317_06845 [Kwoniella heveanensis CBS 569]|nr:hypothetical protein I317_06845 [Kwoniella heveanensis CBS 569]